MNPLILLAVLAVTQLMAAYGVASANSAAWAEYAARADRLKPSHTFPYQDCFERAAAAHGVPVTLLLAVARGESDFDAVARSPANAIGVMQIRWPLTAKHLGIRSQQALYSPCTNIDAGARYLRELTDRYNGSLHLALAAYNYGPSRVKAGNVPAGAAWYSDYIYRHLAQVTRLVPDELPAAGGPLKPYGTGGRLVLLSFNKAWRAQALVEWLDSVTTRARVEWFRAPVGRHQLVLLYDDETERAAGLKELARAGIVSRQATRSTL